MKLSTESPSQAAASSRVRYRLGGMVTDWATSDGMALKHPQTTQQIGKRFIFVPCFFETPQQQKRPRSPGPSLGEQVQFADLTFVRQIAYPAYAPEFKFGGIQGLKFGAKKILIPTPEITLKMHSNAHPITQNGLQWSDSPSPPDSNNKKGAPEGLQLLAN